MVMLSHLWTDLWLWAGPYAVFGFFLLSGYLMARVLDRSYATDGGTRRFFANRALRIYPPYLAVLGLSVALVLALPGVSRRVNPNLVLPTDPLGWVTNLAIFGLHVGHPRAPALIPPGWSVDIELCLYLAIGLVLQRRAGLTAFATLACAGYTAVLLAQGAPFAERYSNVVAGGLPFGAGALLYHGRARIAGVIARRTRLHVAAAAALFTANAVTPHLVPPGYAFYWGFYLSLAAVAWLVAALSLLDPRRATGVVSRVDAFLGSLSYPVFLCHWLVAVLVIWVGLASGKGAALFLWCLPLAPLVAWAIHVLTERPIEVLRDRVRGARVPALSGDST